MRKESQLERRLRRVAADLTDPALRNVYETNADSTSEHFELFEAEHRRLARGDRTLPGR